jgi:peptidoglycan/LPS O-acetylase OafA/YrhL
LTVLHATRTASLGANSTASLDLLRALAANLVLLDHSSNIFHLGLRGFGPLGVSIFFILSGFLIEQSSLARLQRDAPYFKPYMIDRFARIFTAYVPVLLVVVTINCLVDLGQSGQSGASVGAIPFIGNLFLLQDYPVFQILYRVVGHTFYLREYNTAEPFWTIPIEFWIYAVFGLFFFGLMKGEKLGRTVWWVFGLIATPVVIWNAAAGGGNGLSLVWLMGAVGAYVWTTVWHHARHKVALGLVVGLAAAAALVGRGLKNDWPFQDLGMVIAEVMLVLALLSLMEAIPTLPGIFRKPAEFLASYSYSLYLVHNTILVLVAHFMTSGNGWTKFVVGAVLAHAAAMLIYWLFERHYRQVGSALKRRFSAKAAQSAPAGADASTRG